MVFEGFSWLTISGLAGGAAAAAGALHLLRSRPLRHRVVTTLFWSEFRSATRPRTLWHRFSHVLTFLLLLGTCFAIIASLSRPVASPSPRAQRNVVLVVDAGLSMQTEAAGQTRRTQASQAAREVIDTLRDGDRLAIIAAEASPRVLARFEEPWAHSATALDSITPVAAPATPAAAIQLARSMVAGRENGEIFWITDENEPPGWDGTGVIRIPVGLATSNAAILSAVFVTDRLDPARGRLQVRVGWWGESAGNVPVYAGWANDSGELLNTTLRIPRGASSEIATPELAADGRTVYLQITETQGIPADNRLAYPLPNRPEIAIGVGPHVPAALQVALRATPARLVTPDSPDARIRVIDSTAGGPSGPAVVLVREGPLIPAGTPVTLDAATAEMSGRAVCGHGAAISPRPEESALQVLLRAGEHVAAALDVSDPAGPRLLLSDSLFSAGSRVPEDPAFAILIARVVQQLAGWTPDVHTLEPNRAAHDPTWELSDARPFVIAPGTRTASDTWSRDAGAGVPAVVHTRPRWFTPRALILLVACIGVAVQAVLHARGRIV